MSLRSLSVQSRLGLVFGCLVLLLWLVSGFTLHSLSQQHRGFERYAGEVSARQTLVNQLLHEANARALNVRNVLLARAAAERDVQEAKYLKAQERVQAALGRLKEAAAQGTDVSERERELLQAVEAAEARLSATGQSIVKLAMQAHDDDAVVMLNQDGTPLVAALVQSVDRYIADGTQQAAAEMQAAAAAFERSRMLLLGACALAGVLAFVLGLWVTRSITGPIGQALGAAQAVAAGQLDLRIATEGRDEAAQMLRALEAMRAQLARTVADVRRDAEQVATASAQIAQGNQDLSQRTEEQASSLEQTAASMEQLGSTVQHNADNAQQANRLALGASEVAVKGGTVVAQVVQTMKRIEEGSNRIADITGVIDSIAFQTNILALNAAVEAARAGEAGRGFAVVAGEVRSLAQRSAEAAREIKTLISDSVQRVDEGSALVGQAGRTMDEVVAAIRRVTDLMGEISSATTEQSQGVAQVSEAVSQMDQVTQQNAALVEQSAAAAESLRTQAQNLVKSVAVFRLTEADGAAPAATAVALTLARLDAVPAPAAPAANAGWDGTERRGPGRASNVARPDFKRQPAPASLPAPQPSAAASVRTGTDDDEWTSF